MKYTRKKTWYRNRRAWFEVLALANFSIWGVVAARTGDAVSAFGTETITFENRVAEVARHNGADAAEEGYDGRVQALPNSGTSEERGGEYPMRRSPSPRRLSKRRYGEHGQGRGTRT